MARLSRAEIFDPSEIVAVHAIERTVRRCYLLGDDHLTQKNFDHRKKWFEDKRYASRFEFWNRFIGLFLSFESLPSGPPIKA